MIVPSTSEGRAQRRPVWAAVSKQFYTSDVSRSGLTDSQCIDISRYMEKMNALDAFGALSQSTRLDAFRLLVQAGEGGMLAGEISEALDVRQNTMSSNLSILLNAGLLRNAREGRGIRYFADMKGLSGLLGFLLQDCCGGRPELCEPLIDDIAQGCRPHQGVC